MNALARPEVGDYLNSHFASSYQKVGTFVVAGNTKKGGNVASYFSTADGKVLHAIAGPVDAATFLRESRWVIETLKMAQLQKMDATPARLKTVFRMAHFERLRQEHGLDPRQLYMPTYPPSPQVLGHTLDMPAVRHRGLGKQGQVHLLLGLYPLVEIEQVYGAVFEKILNQKLSTLPVEERG